MCEQTSCSYVMKQCLFLIESFSFLLTCLYCICDIADYPCIIIAKLACYYTFAPSWGLQVHRVFKKGSFDQVLENQWFCFSLAPIQGTSSENGRMLCVVKLLLMFLALVLYYKFLYLELYPSSVESFKNHVSENEIFFFIRYRC